MRGGAALSETQRLHSVRLGVPLGETRESDRSGSPEEVGTYAPHRAAGDDAAHRTRDERSDSLGDRLRERIPVCFQLHVFLLSQL